jgi:hypothetical protein
MTFPTDGSDIRPTLPRVPIREPNKDWGAGSVLGLIAAGLLFAVGITYASGYFNFRTASIFDPPHSTTTPPTPAANPRP